MLTTDKRRGREKRQIEAIIASHRSSVSYNNKGASPLFERKRRKKAKEEKVDEEEICHQSLGVFTSSVPSLYLKIRGNWRLASPLSMAISGRRK